MRSTRRRASAAEAAPLRHFAWAPALVATLRHSTLPAAGEETLALTPLADARSLGARDRLSLLAQFAAHHALLQFAGIADGELDPAEWAFVQKRGSDVRLIRTASRAVAVQDSPPALTLAQQFAEQVGASLDVLQQSWARADAVYAEAYQRLTAGAAADLRWMKRAACGAIAAPGPEGLLALTTEQGRFAYDDDDCIASVQRFAEVIMLRGSSPLERFSALRPLLTEVSLDVAAAADRILASTVHPLFVVADLEAFDAASRQVVDLLIGARHGAWLTPHEGEPLPPTRWFVVSPRLRALHGNPEEFVESPAFAAYLTHGDVPPPRAVLPALAEPARSYVGALALLGARIPCDAARKFLGEFLFHGALEDLLVDGVTAIEGDDFVIKSTEIPVSSRANISRVAAAHASGVRAALLWLDAGDSAQAAAVLEQTEWSDAESIVSDLRRVPLSILTPALARRYAHALVDCGRYRDARDLASGDEFLLARIERRMGDYATALARLERLPSCVLHAEVLRLLQRYDDAARVLDACEDDEQRSYERAVLNFDAHEEIDRSWLTESYLSSRFMSYLSSDHTEAIAFAENSHKLARCTIERIDASLDRVFATFSAGDWNAARVAAVEALQEVEETQGDRAAGGILFTLAFLAADAGQHAHASQRIARLRHYYSGTSDELRLNELPLLTAHLDFSRGKLADAKRAATSVLNVGSAQIREAAALILDEIDLIEGRKTPLRSTGKSGNVEMTRRHELLRSGKRATSFEIAVDAQPVPADVELRFLRAAALREFPFAPHDFDTPWCFATRNRLGQWHAIGSHTAEHYDVDGEPDWIECSERELLYIEGCSRWSGEAREAIAALFRTRSENQRLRRVVEQEESARPPQPGALDGIVGDSPSMREICSLVTRIARRDVPVCILGESGTGKELIARAIHRHSPRRPKTFTAVNCAALPENLIESELFGHVRGAFTGADRDRAGLIETTDGGTLFLDEIGEMPLGAQAKLLRFLQEGEFRRVGDTLNRTADVRIVSATNRKLETAVEEGRFRDDLYYRIRGVEAIMPPLRERGSDVLLLASHFLAAERAKHRGGPSMLAPDVEAIFAAYGWPGNVRELQNTIRAAHAMAGEAKEIDLEHLPERLRNVAPAKLPAGSYQDAVARFKRDLIERFLQEARGNQNRAAAMLKISRQALAYQIKELGILVEK
ncbi:MAG TPA: sigma 54-interacting transcriptional regulator [Thermoanaerobaculia bacterium]|nr:sigma 54-interacting transcriptional regulator [Thermoanaerobaculia bacterium]